MPTKTADRPAFGSPVQDNPELGPAFDKMPNDGRRFLVVNTAVGNFREGAVVSAKDFGPSAQIGRLIRLSAIRELTPEEIAAAESDPYTAEKSRSIITDQPPPLQAE